MEAIGAVSAIIGVAQFGLQFSQVLVTVIGDYRDAAKNINRLRDEIHLTSICLQQLGDLASRDLLRQYGILEVTNLCERCQAVFWEIRSTIRKADTPLHPTEINKHQIDVSNFMSFRWALWTKKKLEEPRQELDRLKDSMTLCFVSHMAILATTDLERAKYASQIPGIKRTLLWSEEAPTEDYFRARLEVAGIPQDKIREILGSGTSLSSGPTSPEPGATQKPTVETSAASSNRPTLKAWSLDPLGTTTDMSLSHKWIKRFLEENDEGDHDIWKIQAKLHPWFKKELDNLLRNQAEDGSRSWTLVYLKPVFKSVFSRKIPQCVHVVLRGLPVGISSAQSPLNSISVQPVTYKLSEPIAEYVDDDMPTTQSGHMAFGSVAEIHPESVITEPKKATTEETDEEIIAKQLALYQ